MVWYVKLTTLMIKKGFRFEKFLTLLFPIPNYHALVCTLLSSFLSIDFLVALFHSSYFSRFCVMSTNHKIITNNNIALITCLG